MAYSDFTLAKLRHELGIEQSKTNLFPAGVIVQIEPGSRLLADIEEGLSLPISTEKAKSEQIIYPILREIRRINDRRFSIFSGYTFNVEESKGLMGVCDYLLTRKADIVEVESPVFCLVEAKNGVVEDGYGQCAAEMLAARIFNEQDGDPINVIYGCVTNAFDWVFLKLEGNTIYVDAQRRSLNDLPQLLGILHYVVQVAN